MPRGWPVPQEHFGAPAPWQRLFFIFDPLAQSAEHLPFKQGVRSSNLRRVTNPLKTQCFQGIFLSSFRKTDTLIFSVNL